MEQAAFGDRFDRIDRALVVLTDMVRSIDASQDVMTRGLDLMLKTLAGIHTAVTEEAPPSPLAEHLRALVAICQETKEGVVSIADAISDQTDTLLAELRKDH